MGEVKDMLLKAYLKKGAKQPKAKAPEKKAPDLPAASPPPIKVEKPRTLGNITTAMMAQRIYNPQMPPAPKSPSKAMVDKGTGPAMDISGPWGGPGESK
jgi:hypothetical protein